jgi:DsbE subfamily thiol:disulfide oxidoreductase
MLPGRRKMKKALLLNYMFFILILICFPLSANVHAEGFSPWKIERLVGEKAPEFSVNDLSGKSVSFSSFKGKPTLLNFWATWCPYCREERPYLNSLYREYKDRGLAIVAVSTDKSPQKVKEYLKKIPVDFVVLHDNNKEAAGLYGVYSLPTSFLIDRNGEIKHKIMGLRDWTDGKSKKLIEKLILN